MYLNESLFHLIGDVLHCTSDRVRFHPIHCILLDTPLGIYACICQGIRQVSVYATVPYLTCVTDVIIINVAVFKIRLRKGRYV